MGRRIQPIVSQVSRRVVREWHASHKATVVVTAVLSLLLVVMLLLNDTGQQRSSSGRNADVPVRAKALVARIKRASKAPPTRPPATSTPTPDPTEDPKLAAANAGNGLTPEEEALERDCQVPPDVDSVLARWLVKLVPPSDGTFCIDKIEALEPRPPLQDVAVHCYINRRRFFTVAQQQLHTDWGEIARRRRALTFLAHACPPWDTQHHFVAFVFGSKAFSGGLTEWFLRSYPEASARFLVHAFEPLGRFVASGYAAPPPQRVPHNPDGSPGDVRPGGGPTRRPAPTYNYDNIWLHHAAPWNDTGFVTFVHDRPLPENIPGVTAEAALRGTGLQSELDSALDWLNQRPREAVFHLTHHVPEDHPLLQGVEPARLNTVEAISVSGMLHREASEGGFIVAVFDFGSYNRFLLDHLIMSGSLHFIDELFIVCNNIETDALWADGTTPLDCFRLINTLRAHGVYAHLIA